MGTVIIPGSFDPITLGHTDIIRRTAKIFGDVTVAVMVNENKKYMFALSEREDMVKLAVKDIPGVKVISNSGMLCELCVRLGASAIVKGLRNEVDFGYEIPMAEYNRAHGNGIETLYLQSSEEYKEVSSTVVREAISRGEENISGLDGDVAEYIKNICNKN